MHKKGEEFMEQMIIAPKDNRLRALDIVIDEYEIDFDPELIDPVIELLRNILSAEREEEKYGKYIDLIETVREFDGETFYHLIGVALLAGVTAKKLKLSKEEVEKVVIAGVLHDIGKVIVGADIIRKPCNVSEKEMIQIRKHPVYAYRLLSEVENDSDILFGVLMHHERFCGGGYPLNYQGEQIPLIARILAVCDTFDALTSSRPYHTKSSVQDSLYYIVRSTRYDPYVSSAFKSAFQIGSCAWWK